jgi:hypothetical protein
MTFDARRLLLIDRVRLAAGPASFHPRRWHRPPQEVASVTSTEALSGLFGLALSRLARHAGEALAGLCKTRIARA